MIPPTTRTPTWTWTSGGGGGSGNYRYKLDDSDLTTGATEVAGLEFTPTSDLSDDTHTLYVQERDEAGNWSATGSADTSIDTLAPDIQEFWVTNASTQECHYTSSNTVDIYIDSYENGSGMNQMRFQDAAGTWSSWEAFGSAKSGFDLGEYSYGTKTINGEFSDIAGNVGTAALTVQKDDFYEGCDGDDSMADAWEFTSLLDSGDYYLNQSGLYHVTGDDTTDYDYIQVTVEYGVGGMVIAEMYAGSGALSMIIYNSDGSVHENRIEPQRPHLGAVSLSHQLRLAVHGQDILHPSRPGRLRELRPDVHRRLRRLQRRLHVTRPIQPGKATYPSSPRRVLKRNSCIDKNKDQREIPLSQRGSGGFRCLGEARV